MPPFLHAQRHRYNPKYQKKPYPIVEASWYHPKAKIIPKKGDTAPRPPSKDAQPKKNASSYNQDFHLK
jgi:hypothetical protein